MIALDTNVWIYTHDVREATKLQLARAIVTSASPALVLPWQVGCEFIAASRKLAPIGFTIQNAWTALRDMRNLASSIVLPTSRLWDEAEALMPRFGLSFWDALLTSACIAGGATTLYSEDFGSLSAIHSLTIINPFAVP